MARPLVAMIAIQSQGGLVFGSVTTWERMRIGFELALDMVRSEEVEFRLEMVGLDETVLGRLKVVGAGGKVEGLVRYVGEVVWIHADDELAYDEWAKSMEAGRPAGGTTRWVEQSGFAASRMQGTSPAERARVFKEMEEKRRGRTQRALAVLRASKKAWPNPLDEAAGREAVENGWVQDFAAGAVVRVAPAPQAVRTITSVLAQSKASSAAVGTAPLAHPVDGTPPPRPVPVSAPPRSLPPPLAIPALPALPAFQARVDRSAATPRVTLTWSDAARFRRDAQAHLKYSAIPVDGEVFGGLGTVVEVSLVTPDGLKVPCVGRVVHVGAEGTGLALDLGTGLTAALTAW